MLLKKLSGACLLITGLTLSTLGSAHQGFLAPLAKDIDGEKTILIAGYSEDLFVPEYGLDAKFYLVDPQGNRTELTDLHKFDSATVIQANVDAEKGTYHAFALNERETRYAKKNGKWNSIRNTPANEAPPAKERDYLIESEVTAKTEVITSKTFSKLATNFSKHDGASDAAAHVRGEGFELKFVTQPTALTTASGISFDVLINGKATPNVAFELIEAGEHGHDEHEAAPTLYQSNAQGRVTIPVAEAGKYMISTHYPVVKSGDKPAPVVYQYALSLEVE